MSRAGVTVLAVAAALSGCATTPAAPGDTSRRAALAAAEAACRASEGHRGGRWTSPRWQIEREGDHWLVWANVRGRTMYRAQVPLDGERADCRMQLEG